MLDIYHISNPACCFLSAYGFYLRVSAVRNLYEVVFHVYLKIGYIYLYLNICVQNPAGTDRNCSLWACNKNIVLTFNISVNDKIQLKSKWFDSGLEDSHVALHSKKTFLSQ